MGEHLVFQNGELPGPVQLFAGGVNPGAVAQGHGALGFVQGEIVPDPALKMPGDHFGIAAEGLGGVSIAPAATVLQGLGQLPVVQGQVGENARIQTAVYQPVIVPKPRFVPVSVPQGIHSGPADGEAIGLHPKFFQQGQVLLRTAVAVAGNVAGVAVGDGSGNVTEPVPDALAASVGGGASFYLVGAGCGAPEKVFGEMSFHNVTSTVHSFFVEIGTRSPVRAFPSTLRERTPVRRT